MSATIKDTGEVYVEDDLLGRLDGLKFTADTSQSGLEAQALAAAAQKAVGPEVDRRLTSICSGTHQIFTLSDSGHILWGGMAVGRIAPSGSVFTPDAELIGGELGKGPLREMATDRMREFLRAAVTTQLLPLKALKDLIAAEDTLPAAKGFGYILLENNGAVERRDHLQTVRDLDQDARRQLRSVGVVFGHYNVYLQEMVKPKPARLLSLLVAYGAGGNKTPWIPFAGVTSIPNEGDLESSKYTQQALSLAGYRAVGNRIIRFDILNRLSFLITKLTVSAVEDTPKTAAIETTPTAETTAKTETTEAPTATTEPAKTEESNPTDTPEGVIPPVTQTPPAPTKKRPAKKALTLYNHRVTDEAGVTTEVENLEYWHFPVRGQKGFKPGGRNASGFKKKGQKNQFKGPKPRRNAPSHKKPPTQKQVENSPFAALAALKNPKKD